MRRGAYHPQRCLYCDVFSSCDALQVICGRCRVVRNADIPVVGQMKLSFCSICVNSLSRRLPRKNTRGEYDELRHPYSIVGSDSDRYTEGERIHRRASSADDAFVTANLDFATTDRVSFFAEI